MDKSSTITRSYDSKVKDLVLSSMLITLVFVSTYFIQFHLPISLNSGGLVHLGNTMLFSIAIVFGPAKGAISGAFGMGLFDLASGWVIWAPCTFVVRGVQGFIIGKIANGNNRNGDSVIWNVIAILVSSVWMIAGYFIYNVGMTILSQSSTATWSTKWAAALANGLSSIPGDLLQTAFGLILGLPLVFALKKIKDVAL